MNEPMHGLLSETFDILGPQLSPALFAPAATARLWALVPAMVPVPALRLGFECRLAADRAQVDLQQVALYYMMSRAYRRGARGLEASREAVIAKTRARGKASGSFGNELATGLALCTLLNDGIHDEVVERAIAYLMRSHQRQGSWRTRPFTRGPEPPGPHSIWWASQAATTAVCLEGLVRGMNARAG